MWLVGVVIRRYIDILIIIINFPYSTCIRSFFGSSILTSLFILKMFFRSLHIYTYTFTYKGIEASKIQAVFQWVRSRVTGGVRRCLYDSSSPCDNCFPYSYEEQGHPPLQCLSITVEVTTTFLEPAFLRCSWC